MNLSVTSTPVFEAVAVAASNTRPHIVGRTINNALILGFESKNGHRYTRGAMAEALPLFNGVKVYADHVRRGSSARAESQDRSVRDIVGRVSDPWLSPEGVRAKVHIVDGELGRAVLSDPEAYGLSPVSYCTMSKDRKTIESISHVVSVDLVCNPATSKHLMESVDDKQATPKAKSYEELRTALGLDVRSSLGARRPRLSMESVVGVSKDFAELRRRLSREKN